MKEEIIKIIIQVLGEPLAQPYIKYLNGLEKDSDFLSCLQSAGVDNWNGYDYAVELFKEE